MGGLKIEGPLYWFNLLQLQQNPEIIKTANGLRPK